jgi:hypothetical protein
MDKKAESRYLDDLVKLGLRDWSPTELDKRSKDVHTVHKGSDWVNEVDGVVVSTHDQEEAAEAWGREIARDNESEHFIHDMEGQIRKRNSYGPDPTSSKG